MTAPLSVCTIIARNYWAQARVLARSVLAHHPDATVTALVVDADERSARQLPSEPFRVLCPSELGIDRREFERMAGIYGLLELATALKPSLLSFLVRERSGPVVYLDPDIQVFAPIDAAADEATSHGIALTPHVLEPLPQDDHGPTELSILQTGAYNLGFIAVAPSGAPFLDWWEQRLRRDGLIAKQDGMFVDQKWVDLAPSLFEPLILKDPGWNVAYWNLPARTLELSDDGYLVDGGPLRFFHYSGFDPNHPGRLSFYEGDRPRMRLEEHPIVADLCGQYARRLVANGYHAYSQIPYAFGRTPAGLRLDRRSRHVYRQELILAERVGAPEPPNPFRSAQAFERWLCEFDDRGVTRYLRAVHDVHPELHGVFPNLEGTRARYFVEWASSDVRVLIPPQLVPIRRSDEAPDVPGVNLFGYTRAESGVGQVSRALTAALDRSSFPFAVVSYANTKSRQEAPHIHAGTSDVVHDTNIICVNADQLPHFLDEAGRESFEGRRNIGVWAWELDTFPDALTPAIDLVDEIWTLSGHAARGIRARTHTPVFVFPLPIATPAPVRMPRAELGLPDGFAFLFSFDFDSVFVRKNPLAVVEAFSRAFPPGSGRHLVIKTVRGEAHPEHLQTLRTAASARRDIHVIDGYVSALEQEAIVASCDAYVSLHRAEGFGLTIAEAMALGKPVVATGYSGNLEFMDSSNSWLVPYELVEIPSGCDPYPPGAHWAEPDIDASAEAMRVIAADPSAARARGERAAADVARLHAPDERVPFLVERLAERWLPPLLGSERPDEFVIRIPDTDRAAMWTPAASAEHHVTTGPDIGSQSRYGAISRAARRAVTRAARHSIEHQERINASLLDAVRELEQRLDNQAKLLRELTDRVHASETSTREMRSVEALDVDVSSLHEHGR